MTKKDSTIQSKIKKLDQLIKQFEDQEQLSDLDKAISSYEEAMKLVSEIRTKLQGAELKIKKIKEDYSLEEQASF